MTTGCPVYLTHQGVPKTRDLRIPRRKIKKMKQIVYSDVFKVTRQLDAEGRETAGVI